MRYRAPSSGITLTARDAAIIKGMLERGDRQHDIAAWFGVNGGRVAEIATGRSFGWVAVSRTDLPTPGPYPSGRKSMVVVQALAMAREALANAEVVLRAHH